MSIHAASATHRGNRYGYDRWRSAANMYLLDDAKRDTVFFAGDTALVGDTHHMVERILWNDGSRARPRAPAHRLRALVEAGLSKGPSHARRRAHAVRDDFARASSCRITGARFATSRPRRTTRFDDCATVSSRII